MVEDNDRRRKKARHPGQSEYAFTKKMLTKYVAISEKLTKTVGQAEVSQQLAIFDNILKVQLAKHIRAREKFPPRKDLPGMCQRHNGLRSLGTRGR